MYDQGSQWSKWDLHVHTQYSHLNGKYNCTSKEIAAKIISEQIAVVGVTNYFIVESQEIEELAVQLNGAAYIIPNFEFRINEKNKDGEYINIHILFNPETTTIKRIHESLSRVELTNIASQTKVYCTIDNIKKLDAASITISFKELCDQLNKDFINIDDFMIVGVNKGYGGFCPGNKPRDQELALKIDTLSHFIFSKKDDVEFFLNKVTGRDKHSLIPKAVVECSDAHTIGDIGAKFSWVKAEPTYEGLKQIIFEPDHRIKIADIKPREPLRKIEGIKFSFPNKTTIRQIDSLSHQDLCIKHLKEIKFNQGFTCLIGGRGTGKSTIINILAEKAGIKTDFFNKHKNSIYVDNKPFNFDTDQTVVNIIGTTDIEFVSQGRVENLAEGDELTKLIFNERIQEVAVGLGDLQAQFEGQADALDEVVKLILDFRNQEVLKREKEKERDNAQRVVDSEKDPRYKLISDGITAISSKISLIENSKKNYNLLIDGIRDLINETILNKDTNKYEERIIEIIGVLRSIKEIEIGEDKATSKAQLFNDTDKASAELDGKLITEIGNLKAFFAERGTSEDSIKDSQNANEIISKASQQIIELDQKLASIKTKLTDYAQKAAGIKETFTKIDEMIKTNLLTINEKLSSTNTNVLPISFTHEFDFELYKKSLFTDFYDTFKQYQIANTQVDKICEVLFSVEPNEDLIAFDYTSFMKKLNSSIDKSYNRTTNYVTVIANIFKSSANYTIYKSLVKKHLFNLIKYLKIKGFYGKRELKACSFGQRCTAVIVTLLMTGVKPLVIDEPEAHLDNKLIADYLVELIKDKRLDRQIIFATHNSNFVVNGDAELIHILEIPDNSIYTNITSTTIEDKLNRTKLLKLEGGKDAFLSRENKYGLQTR